MKKDPTQSQLKKLFTCDNKGNLYHAKNGKLASHINATTGRVRTTVNGNRYYAPRLVYIINNGPIKNNHDIDHINGNPLDNRPSNLRQCTRSQNILNSKLSSANTSGYKNVSLSQDGETYFVQMQVRGTIYRRAGFATAVAADKAARKMRRELAGEFARDK